MYAKLTFNGGTTTAGAVRDIVRLITDSNSGSASLSNLEFVNTNASELVAGVNSGWSLHSSSNVLPSSGSAINASDSNYILQGSTATSSKAKYCGIHANGSWTTSSVYNGTAFGVTLANVLDPGATTEMWSNGYTGNNTAQGGSNAIMPTGIHVWADPRRIIFHGVDNDSRNVLLTHMEASETPNTTYRNLPPVAVFCNGVGIDLTAGEQVSYRGDTSAVWDDPSDTQDWISFTGSAYCNYPGQESVIRSIGWHRWGGSGQGTDSNRSSNWYCWRGNTRSDNGTQYGAIYSGSPLSAMNTGLGIEFLVPSSLVFWGPNHAHTYFDSASSYDATYGRADAQAFDSAGNVGIPKFPLIWNFPPIFNSDSYDFTSQSGIWRTSANLGATGDTVTIGSDVYQYVAHTTAPLGAFLIKRT
jgi:hypothetical protein